MKTLYMTFGLPASGKTTWAKATMAEHPGSYKRVNKDDLRAMLDDGKWSRDNEKFVLSMSRALIDGALGQGSHVIVDDTNLHPKHEAALRECAKKRESAFEIVSFAHVSVDECVERDRKRPNYVGEKVIRGMYDQFLRPPTPEPKHDPDLADIVLVDIDGTVAQMNGRGPFEWHRVGEDLPRMAVIRAVASYGLPWVYFSGRDESCRELTQAWLNEHIGTGAALYMRPAGDIRKDCIVKRELFDAHIAGKFNVRAIFDDRPQVIRMWREMGYGDRLFDVGDGREF